jgi:ankyrin repeat protein
MIAAWMGYGELLKFLLAQNRSLEEWDRNLIGYLQAAISGDRQESVAKIFDAMKRFGGPVKLPTPDELSLLIWEGTVLKFNRAVRFLIEEIKVFGDLKDPKMRQSRALALIMHQACFQGNVEIVEVLLRAGFPPDMVLVVEYLSLVDEGSELNTPMLAALGSLADGCSEVVQLLRDWGAPSVDITKTPLAGLFESRQLPKAPTTYISHRPWVNITVAQVQEV